MGYELQVRLFRDLRDPCGTFYPQNGLARVRDAQHSARFLTIQDQVRLLEQATNIRTRVVAGHGMIGVAKQSFPIFGGYAAARNRHPNVCRRS